MWWVRGLVVVFVLLTFAALVTYMSVFYSTPPDARMACYHGAYRTDKGALIVVTPTTGQSLRIVMMSGLTWRLSPLGRGDDGIPHKFAPTVGWTDQKGAPPVAETVEFGSCKDGTVKALADGSVARRETFDITDATFESHGQKLSGRLVMPRVEGPVPVAVLMHGSEWDSAVLFNRLQYLFPANGIGVFVFDKRGTGKSEGKYTQDFDLLADDAAAALAKAKEMAGTLASEVGFQGGSQAGWIEPLAATKTKADFVLVGFGLAESPLAEDREEVFEDLRRAGYGDDIIEKAREITKATGRVVASHFKDGFDDLDAVRAKYGKEPWYAKVNGEFTGIILGMPNWLIRIIGPMVDVGTPMEYDPLPPLKTYQGPHLWVLGGRDSSAPSENTLRILREVQSVRPNLEVVVFPNADHGIIEFEEKDGVRNETRFSEGYFQLVVDWILFKQVRIENPGPVHYKAEAPTTTTP